MTERKFLVVRLGSMGDIVHTFPAIAGLRESFQDSEVIWLTHPRWEALVRASRLADQIAIVDTRNWASLRDRFREVRRGGFETAIDYQGLWKSAAIPFLAGVPRRIGFSSHTIREAGVHLLYTDCVRVNAGSHLCDQNGELSLRAGSRVGTARVTLEVPASDQGAVKDSLRSQGINGYVVLSPGGGWRSKCWPAERFGSLAQRLWREEKLPCIVNVGPGEEDLLAAVRSAAGDAQPVPWLGTLQQLMALLKNARAVVAGDTGPLHLADALRVPVVAIFGPTDPSRNGPYWHSGVVLRWEGALTTYKRGNQPDESLLHVSVDEVLSALRGLWETA
jgi:heptosyltransferase-1